MRSSHRLASLFLEDVGLTVVKIINQGFCSFKIK